MTGNTTFLVAAALAASALAATDACNADIVGNTITYQGRLDVDGLPADGTFDFRLRLAVDDDGDPLLTTKYIDDVVVVDGHFTINVDFGPVFNSFERWILAAVRPGEISNADRAEASYTALGPAQEVRATPLALYAMEAGALDLPIDEASNIVKSPCFSIRNNSFIAMKAASDNSIAMYAETTSGTALMATADDPTGWAATFFGRCSITNGGLGIGTANLGSLALAVNGSAAKPGGGSWSTLSDARAKHDVQPITDALATALALRGVTFTYDQSWIDRGLGLPGRQIGFVAQEVEAAIPGWIERMDDGTLLVTERGATALLVEALREVEARRAAAEFEVRELKSSLQALTERLERLERAMSERSEP